MIATSTLNTTTATATAGSEAEAGSGQGGDLRSLAADVLPLSTCVNTLGPGPAATDALRNLHPKDLTIHPFGAASRFQRAYADYWGVAPGDLVVGTGISQFITVLTQVLPSSRTAVLTPDYTETIARIPHHIGLDDPREDSVEARLVRLDDAMRRFDFVALSNPNNPLGLTVPVEELVALARRHPATRLIVDEAYQPFLDPVAPTAATAGLANIVVLGSPGKPFGMAASRTGGAVIRDDALRTRVADKIPTWPLSHACAHVTCAALADDRAWARQSQWRLRSAADRMERQLVARFGDAVRAGTGLHFRFVHHRHPEDAYQHLLSHGVAVRRFHAGPGRASGLRILAPLRSTVHDPEVNPGADEQRLRRALADCPQ